MSDKKDHFEHRAKDYDKNAKRVSNVQNIADGILKNIDYTKQMHIIDFGSGTGLLAQEIAPYVKKITAVDTSAAMNEVLQEKVETFPCELEVLKLDILDENSSKTLKNIDGIISSMTIHHVKDTEALLKKFYTLLDTDGTIALADLETEDGGFHSDNTGVHHYGFDKDEFLAIAKKVGFRDLCIKSVSIASKPHGEFPIFLLTGKK